MDIIKALGNSALCNSTPNSFGSNPLVRLSNITTNVYLATQKNANGDVLSTVIIPPSGVLIIEKGRTDTLESNTNANVYAVAVAYKS